MEIRRLHTKYSLQSYILETPSPPQSEMAMHERTEKAPYIGRAERRNTEKEQRD